MDETFEYLPHNLCLAVFDFQHRTDPGRLPVHIEPRRIEHRFQSVAIWPTAAPVMFLGLTGEPAVYTLAQIIQEDFIHQALEATMYFASLAGGIVAVARGDDAQPNELQAANRSLAFHGIARQSREIIDDEDIELMPPGRRQHRSVLRPVRIAATHRGISKGRYHTPAFQFRTLSTVAELIFDTGGPLQVGAETRIESGFHFRDSICFK